MEPTGSWIIDPVALPVALCRVDAEGRLEEANPAATRLLGEGLQRGANLAAHFLRPDSVAELLRTGGAMDAGVRTTRGLVTVRLLVTPDAPRLVLIVEEPAASGSVLARLNHRVSQPLMAAMVPLELMLLARELTPGQHERVERAYDLLVRVSELLQSAAAGEGA